MIGSTKLVILGRIVLFFAILSQTFACGGDDDDNEDGQAADDSAADDSLADDSSDDADDAADDTETPDDDEAPLPVTAQVIVDGVWDSTEGIAFLPDGRLFVAGDTTVSEVFADGSHEVVVEMTHPLGMAGDGEGGLIVAEYGPTDCFDLGPSYNDGSVVGVTPDGQMQTLAEGIPDPNFIAVLPDKTFLVSDDCGKSIWRVPYGGGVPEVYYESVLTPNGMVLSLDESEMYVCQTFEQEDSIIPDRRVWRVPLSSEFAPGEPSLLVQLPALSTPDGGVLDEKGRLYVAANLAGTIWRIDPDTGETFKVAEDMFAVASLAFGRGGDFPETSLYATQLYGGKVWKLDLGVRGAPIP